MVNVYTKLKDYTQGIFCGSFRNNQEAKDKLARSRKDGDDSWETYYENYISVDLD